MKVQRYRLEGIVNEHILAADWGTAYQTAKGLVKQAVERIVDEVGNSAMEQIDFNKIRVIAVNPDGTDELDEHGEPVVCAIGLRP